MAIFTLRTRPDDLGATRVIHSGDFASGAALVAHCAATGIDCTRADFVAFGHVLDDIDVSGLTAPKSDLRGVSCKRWIANKRVGGRQLELSAAWLQGTDFTGSDLTVANLACTQPTKFLRVSVGPNTRLRGCEWSGCPDVIVLPVRDDTAGKVIAIRNGGAWRVHAGDRGVQAEATAKTALQALTDARDPTLAQKYQAAFAWLESAAGVAAKAAIEVRAVAVVLPGDADAETKL